MLREGDFPNFFCYCYIFFLNHHYVESKQLKDIRIQFILGRQLYSLEPFNENLWDQVLSSKFSVLGLVTNLRYARLFLDCFNQQYLKVA